MISNVVIRGRHLKQEPWRKTKKVAKHFFSTVTNEVMLFFSVHELIMKKSEKQICYVLELLFQLKCYLDLS